VDDLEVYLPPDRRAALACGATLPEHTHGAAMFADITGFTPLAEALAQNLGARHGAEALTALLNQVYSALITQLERFGGSVVGFSGDAITCWFDDMGVGAALPALNSQRPPPGVLRALAAALAMRRAMNDFAAIPTPSGATATLMVKIAVAAGPIRRFLIGDPQIQVLDVLAGGTLNRLSDAAHLAERDDVVVDTMTLAWLEPPLRVAGWRLETETQQRAAIIAELLVAVDQVPWPARLADRLSDGQLRPWVLPAVYARVRHSADPFLAELRPAVALMLQFGGLDYDTDEAAGAKLDAYIRKVQLIVTGYEGHLVDVTMADKGGYLFAAFGALHAHEDDTRRAALAALELAALQVTPESEAPRIGISQGTMRTGPYGGATRRTYGVLGDEVNVACRLMSAAAPRQILASAQVRQALKGMFQWAALPAIQLKGKRSPITIYQLLGELPALSFAFGQASATSALIGREAEIAALNDALAALLAGTGGSIVVDGEPGIGKSRLLAELAGIVHQRGGAILAGSGQRIEQTSYHPWRAIFNAYFGFEHESSLPERQARVQAEVGTIAPRLLNRLPLLNDMLNLGLGDTDFTRSLDAADRGEQLAELLVELLCARASRQPLTILLDDAHLLDSCSLALANRTAQACLAPGDSGQPASAILLVLSLRSIGADHPAMPQLRRLLGLRGTRRIVLGALTAQEITALTAARLAVNPADIPLEIASLLHARAGGNPLFAEELIQTLRDERAIHIETVSSDGGQLVRRVASHRLHQASQNLPATLQGLILGRIDRLPPAERLTLRVASVLGPVFEFQVLHAIRNQQAEIDEATLKNQLRALAAQDFIWLERPEPHLAYRFKHILTQETAYQSLLYAQRRAIHRVIAEWYEQTFGGSEFSIVRFQSEQPTTQNSELETQNLSLVPYVPLLAYHYRMAEDMERERPYVALLGEQAVNVSAFQEAITHFERAFTITPRNDAAQRSRLAIQLGRSYAFSGDLDEAERRYQASMELAAAVDDRPGEAEACFELGALAHRRKTYHAALELLDRSLALFRAAGRQRGEARVLDRMGGIYIELGEEARALECYQKALTLGRKRRSSQR
jgi:predicted ATPase/class 3 adenylate cyclase